eukprot:11730908-Alexandrium_andersonii.AAC.1
MTAAPPNSWLSISRPSTVALGGQKSLSKAVRKASMAFCFSTETLFVLRTHPTADSTARELPRNMVTVTGGAAGAEPWARRWDSAFADGTTSTA